MNTIFGIHSVIEAISSGKEIEKILIKKGMEGINIDKIVQLCQKKSIPIQYVPIEKLDRTTSSRHQGVIACISQITYTPLEEAIESVLATHPHPIVLLLDGVTDVRNFGAISRTAECAGVSLIIIPAKGGASINAESIKSSSGALLRIPVSRVPNLRIALFYLKENGFSIIGTTEKSGDSLFDSKMQNATAVVLGSEDKGISTSVLALCDQKVSIPMQGAIASLNVSAAAAIVLFEVVRQRIFTII